MGSGSPAGPQCSMKTLLFLLLLFFVTLDRLDAITCAIFDYSRWVEKECPQSSYCQTTHTVSSNSNGNSMIHSDVSCGLPHSQASTSEPTINAPSLSEELKSIYNVRETKFCPYGEGRWCRMTPGPQSCWYMNCVILECRCTQNGCLGLGSVMLEEIEQNTSGFGEIWRQENGGKICMGSGERVAGMAGLILTLLLLQYNM